jgi:hypothetical protein
MNIKPALTGRKAESALVASRLSIFSVSQPTFNVTGAFWIQAAAATIFNGVDQLDSWAYTTSVEWRYYSLGPGATVTVQATSLPRIATPNAVTYPTLAAGNLPAASSDPHWLTNMQFAVLSGAATTSCAAGLPPMAPSVSWYVNPTLSPLSAIPLIAATGDYIYDSPGVLDPSQYMTQTVVSNPSTSLYYLNPINTGPLEEPVNAFISADTVCSNSTPFVALLALGDNTLGAGGGFDQLTMNEHCYALVVIGPFMGASSQGSPFAMQFNLSPEFAALADDPLKQVLGGFFIFDNNGGSNVISGSMAIVSGGMFSQPSRTSQRLVGSAQRGT